MPENNFVLRYRQVVSQMIGAFDALQSLKNEYDALNYSETIDEQHTPEHFTAQQFKDAVASAEAIRATFNTGHNTNLHRIKAS